MATSASGASPHSIRTLESRNQTKTRGLAPPNQLSSLLDLPNELLLLIAREAAQSGMVIITVPSLPTPGSDRVHGSIYHLSLVSRHLRDVCSEFLFQNIRFLVRCSSEDFFFDDIEWDISYLSRSFEKHVKDHDSIRRVSFVAWPETDHVDEALSYQRLLLPFILDLILKCPNLQWVALPNFFTLNKWLDDAGLLGVVNDHPSPDLLILYPEIEDRNCIPFGMSSHMYSFSRVMLRLLDVSCHSNNTKNSIETLLKRGLRIQILAHSQREVTSWKWYRMSLPKAGLQTVTGWFPSLSETQSFLDAHPLVKTLEVNVGSDNPNDASQGFLSWLAANIPGVGELVDMFRSQSTQTWTLMSLTVVRPNRGGVWQLEEARVCRVCYSPQQVGDCLTLAANLRKMLPAQIQTVTFDKLRVTRTEKTSISSALAKDGLKVRWLNR
ncbi:hypothetical protein K435DRAFT_962394 [Dendrothele bispora CBS 962.96]|uniref:Uncharacterized protein n=1 Tax=Dendrothele bispora (strain CBS 962.96) TaxID=1314807 RepID=A0A4S8MLA9_DENBC|nr:hypothetical protein K435DRAFT_962394 [Dendrothele bispora CBS 962.96]